MSNSLFIAPLLFQHDLMVLFPHILHVCLHLNQSDPETTACIYMLQNDLRLPIVSNAPATSYVPLSQIL
jgi:hypothetical protein